MDDGSLDGEGTAAAVARFLPPPLPAARRRPTIAPIETASLENAMTTARAKRAVEFDAAQPPDRPFSRPRVRAPRRARGARRCRERHRRAGVTTGRHARLDWDPAHERRADLGRQPGAAAGAEDRVT